jgi:DNA-binding response OmpR family regulator
MKNILIVENDLGFIFWLGGALMAADYQPWPACGVSEANALAGKTAIDLLIVNPSLPGVSKLIAVLRRSQAKLKVIALGAEGEIKLSGIDAWRCKPGPAEKSAKQEWLKAVKNVFIGRKRAA